jgi:hypothetical protein
MKFHNIVEYQRTKALKLKKNKHAKSFSQTGLTKANVAKTGFLKRIFKRIFKHKGQNI